MGIAPKPSGFCSTKEGKLAVIERTKQLVDQSSLIITIPFEGVTKENTDILRKALPEGITASIVKNALMRKAVEGTNFAVLADNLKQENMFFFIPEGQARPSFDAFKKWQKEIKRMEPEYDARTLVIDGQAFVGSQLEYVVSLPTKLELITKIAVGIKATPLKLARAVKAVPNKFGRAFGCLKTKLEDEQKELEGAAAAAAAAVVVDNNVVVAA